VGFEHSGSVPDLVASARYFELAALRRSPGTARRDGFASFGSMTRRIRAIRYVAAALASIDLVLKENWREFRVGGRVLHQRLRALQSRYKQIGSVDAKAWWGLA